MRIIIFLFLIFLFPQPSFSQEPPVRAQQPTQAQMQEQMLNAKNRALKQIADREKKIAAAKANNENPETIIELEKQLVTMKKMLGVMDKAGSLNDSRPKTLPVNTYPMVKYISPIIPIPLNQPVVAPTEAQAKDRLLWYRGKKMNDSMMVTTQKMVVLYSKKRNMVIVKPDEKQDSTFISIVKNLAKTEQRKTEFVTGMKGEKNSFLMYPEILKAYQEFDLIQNRYNKIVKNTINLPALPGHTQSGFLNPGNIGRGGGPLFDYEINIAETPAGLEEMYQQLLDLMNNQPSLDFPTPPKRPNDLCLCDPDLREKYEADISKWNDQFSEYETKLLESVLDIEAYLSLFHGTRGASVAGMPNLYADIDKALKLSVTRKDKKIVTLTSRYIGDVHREEAVVQAIIAAERERQKLGLGKINSTARAIARDILLRVDFDKYMDQEMQAKNYNVVFDYSLYLNHEYHKQLFGVGGTGGNSGFFRWKSWLLDFNRFRFNIDMDFEVQFKDDDEPGMIVTGNLKATETIVSLGRLGCKWQLFITNTNYESGDEIDFKIPVTVKGGIKRVKENNVWKDYPYTGPRDMLMVFPSVRISFCQNGNKDSALMDVLRYKTEDLSGYAVKTDNSYTIDLLGYASKMFVSVGKVQNNADQLVDQAYEMMSIRSRFEAERPQPTGNSLLDQIQIEYSMNQQQHEMQRKLTESSKVPKTVILFDAQNNSNVLIDKTTDTANKEYVIDLTKGLIRLKVVHSPNAMTLPSQTQY